MSEKIIVHCPYCDIEHSVRIVIRKYKAYTVDKVIKYYDEAYYCKKKKRMFCDIKLFLKNHKRLRERQEKYEEFV